MEKKRAIRRERRFDEGRRIPRRLMSVLEKDGGLRRS